MLRYVGLALLCLSAAGCGSPGKDESVKHVKSVLKAPDSFRLVSYDYNKKLSLSRMNYTFRDELDLERSDKMYFKVGAEGIVPIACDDLPTGLLDYLESRVSTADEFQSCVVGYRGFVKTVKENSYPIYHLLALYETSDMNSEYSRYVLGYFSQDYCTSLRTIKDSWEKLPELAKSHIANHDKKLFDFVNLPFYDADAKSGARAFTYTFEKTDIF